MHAATRRRRLALLPLLVLLAVGLAPSEARAAAGLTLSASPTTLSIGRGEATTVSVTLKASGGFSGPVSLSSTAAASSGLRGSFSPASVTLAGNGTARTTLTVSASSTAPFATSGLTLRATGRGVTAATNLSVGVVRGDFSLALSPSARTVQGTQPTTYQVTLTPVHRFTGTVRLQVAGLPSGATASFSPATLTLQSTAARTSVLTVAAGAGTPRSTSTPTVTATGGGVTHSGAVTLTVSTAAGITVAAPSRLDMQRGRSVTGTVSVTRTGFSGPVSLSLSGLPSGVTGRLTPAQLPAGATSATLTLSAGGSATTGTFPVTVTGTVPSGSTSSALTGRAIVTLVVDVPAVPFTVTGPEAPITALTPGGSAPLNLRVSNPNGTAITITSLTVAVSGVAKGATAPPGACAASDFGVVAAPPPVALTLQPGASATLAQLGLPQASWPKLTMVNAPTRNQDGCKRARIALAFGGAASGGIT